MVDHRVDQTFMVDLTLEEYREGCRDYFVFVLEIVQTSQQYPPARSLPRPLTPSDWRSQKDQIF